MARRHKLLLNLKTIAGAGLIGLGLFILFGNVTGAAAGLSDVARMSADATQTFGVITVLGLGVSRVFQCYLFDRAGLLRGLCGILILFWPLLFVVAGTVLVGMGSESV
jgi:hypothetical protein